MKTKRIIVEIFAALLVLLFLYTGLSKLVDYSFFKSQLKISPWGLLASMAGFTAWALPAFEVLLSLALIVPRTRQIGFVVSAVLLLVFNLYLTLMLQFGDHIPCSCGGVFLHMGWTEHILINFGFVVVAVMGYLMNRKLQRNVETDQGVRSYAPLRGK